jgi:hypothetical protein
VKNHRPGFFSGVRASDQLSFDLFLNDERSISFVPRYAAALTEGQKKYNEQSENLDSELQNCKNGIDEFGKRDRTQSKNDAHQVRKVWAAL